ncbi:MAG: translation factor GTPase family protein [Chloroflexota bacterium]
MHTLNLGILAHVDAGKRPPSPSACSSAAGAIDRIGSVDAGTTQTDTLELERERGITIRAAVASFFLGDVAVNLVDTPGHPDFIAEVERALRVLDGAVLVVSAVEGIQPQTPLLFRALRRLNVPTLIFVNKVDRAGADPDRLVEAMARRLSPGVLPMASVRGAGGRAAEVQPLDAEDASVRARLAEVLADHDEAIFEAFVDDPAAIPAARLQAGLVDQVRAGVVHPVFFGSAALGIGTDQLLDGVTSLLRPAPGDPEAPVSGRVFKVERTTAGERVAYVRLFAGTLRPRQRVRVGNGDEAKPTSIAVFAPAGAPRHDALGPGQMATVRGLAAVRVGDAIGEPPPGEAEVVTFPRPGLEAVVAPLRDADAGSLRAALAQLAEQDPLIDVRQDDRRHEISVSIYGEVQKEVIAATLERDYGIATAFRETTTVCIERPAGIGEAEEVIRAATHSNTGRSSPLSANPFVATPALRVASLPPGSGIQFEAHVEPRLIPLYVSHARRVLRADRGVRARGAGRGPAGWEVTDCAVTMTDCGYVAGQHAAGLPAPDPAGPGAGARAGADVGLPADGGDHA